jgi:hypothetical protein
MSSLPVQGGRHVGEKGIASRPKLLVLGEHRFHAHGRAGLVDHVVDQEQCAFAQAASGAELTDENVAASNDQAFDFNL